MQELSITEIEEVSGGKAKCGRVCRIIRTILWAKEVLDEVLGDIGDESGDSPFQYGA